MAQQPELPKDMFEFMQKMWNPLNFPLPGMFTPTVNLEDIEKKINEMKTVETWLTMNIGFIQMTIKTLEMQKAALESLAAAAPKAGEKK
ncbi:MAG: hypothetical protein OEP48_03275 [Betaproteobacteria bacterium]|nr:hypothetical protein [Betaproteobacteria bacterium]MDH3436265.1 hypothetical protein [Betaproteobacteria bacterium]